MSVISEVDISGFHVICHETLVSTNDEAKKQALSGAAEKTVIQSLSQTSGHGRRGNKWESPKGNLYLSFILRPEVKVSEAGQLSFVMAIALADTIKTFVSDENTVSLKWPNDVLLNNKKLAGILLESEILSGQNLDWIVAGVGINIKSSPDYAISLNDVSGVSKEDVLKKLCETFKKHLHTWEVEGFTKIRFHWLESASNIGKNIIVRLPREEIHGVFKGLGNDGSLILTDKDGHKKVISSGEVFFG